MIRNPYARAEPAQQQNEPAEAVEAAQNNTTMGPQSQRRQSLNQRGRHANPRAKKKTKTAQTTIVGDNAFDPIVDCIICKAKASGLTPRKRAHHPLCKRNIKTRGLVGQAAEDARAAEALRARMSAPVQPHERMNIRPTQEDGDIFFRFRETTRTATATMAPATTQQQQPQQPQPQPQQQPQVEQQHKQQTEQPNTATNPVATPEDIAGAYCEVVGSKNSAPLGVYRFSLVVFDELKKTPKTLARLDPYFQGIVATIPSCETSVDATYHSVVGQKLYVVDWQRFYPSLELLCPICKGQLKQTRTNFSNKRSLFPIFNIDGMPSWAMVMQYQCQGCSKSFAGNDGELLCKLPAHIASQYPVEPKYATGQFHISQGASNIFEELMITYGNGNLCSRLLYNAMCKAYTIKLMEYYSLCKMLNKKPEEYPKKNKGFITIFAPNGASIRKLHKVAANSKCTPGNISDKERHTREIQGVKCNAVFAHDHTFDVSKNYKGLSRKHVVWDLAQEDGQIGTIVLVEGTKTREIACAAEQWIRRTHSIPRVMYTDTFPAKDAFWTDLTGEDQGRLGLFHYIRRITRTLRPTHFQFNKAIKLLLKTIYSYHKQDYDNLLFHLKAGSFGKNTVSMKYWRCKTPRNFATDMTLSYEKCSMDRNTLALT